MGSIHVSRDQRIINALAQGINICSDCYVCVNNQIGGAIVQITIPIANAEAIRLAVEQDQAVLIDWIRAEIKRDKLTLRKLALVCGLNKTRLGYILHPDPCKRRVAQNAEILLILKAMGLNPIQASVMMEASHYSDETFTSLFDLLARLYVALPLLVMNAIKDIQGMDGSLIRPEWAEALAIGIAKKLKEVVMQCQLRRDLLTEL